MLWKLDRDRRDCTDVIRVGLLKDNGKKATKKKKPEMAETLWPLPAGDAFVKKEGDREDVENHAYLDEELPDLLVEVVAGNRTSMPATVKNYRTKRNGNIII